MLYKFGTIIIFVLAFSSLKTINAQYSYSIDINTNSARNVPLKYAVTQARKNIKKSAKLREKKRNTLKDSKKIRKHTYSIQTREVKKRMRKTSKKADNYNKGKVPMVVKLKNILNG